MDEFFQKVTSQQDPFKKLASYIPGFSGYIERQNRRDADKIIARYGCAPLRRTMEAHLAIAIDMVSNGMIAVCG